MADSAIEDDDDDYKLIIGLGVGIPLFFIACIIVAVLIYNCVRKRKDTAASTQLAETSEHRSVRREGGSVCVIFTCRSVWREGQSLIVIFTCRSVCVVFTCKS